jgi:hypothetical protein
MDYSHRLIAIPLALALAAGAFANDDKSAAAAENPEAVAKLKSALTDTAGFEVETVRSGDDGATCIVYRVDNDQGGETKAYAVVEGDKVLRSTSRSKKFEDAWNEKCVAGRDTTANAKN